MNASSDRGPREAVSGRYHLPRSLRLREEVVVAFQEACRLRDRKAAAVLTVLLEEYLELGRLERVRLHGLMHGRIPTEPAKSGGGVAYSCRLPADLLERLEVQAEEEMRSPLNIIEWVMAFWSLPDGDGTLSSAVTP